MAISLSNKSKSKITLSKEDKTSSMTWDEAEWTWDEAESTWNQPEYVLTKVSKSKVSLSNESK